MTAAFFNFEPDGRLTVVTEDGATTSDQPVTFAPEAHERIAELPDATRTDATVTVEGYWDDGDDPIGRR